MFSTRYYVYMSYHNAQQPQQPETCESMRTAGDRCPRIRPIREKKKWQLVPVTLFNFNQSAAILLSAQHTTQWYALHICINNLRLWDSWIVFIQISRSSYSQSINVSIITNSMTGFIFNHHRFSQLIFQCSGCMQCRRMYLARAIGENMSSYFVFFSIAESLPECKGTHLHTIQPANGNIW
jgi:hypothetical protein